MKLTVINLKQFSLLIFLSLPAMADDQPYTEYKTPIYHGEVFKLRLYEVLPRDAAVYVDRARTCQHWSGEPAYDDERAAKIKRNVEASCTGLEGRKKSINEKYKSGSNESELITSIVGEIESGET